MQQANTAYNEEEALKFSFGKNWSEFLNHFDETRLKVAIGSLTAKIGDDLKRKKFLDIGSGSGLFSLAAHRLGADVTSFDFDNDSVGCTSYLKKTYADDAENWKVMQGSALDKKFIDSLGQFDIVYSWGVLHHTGDMYTAFENVHDAVKEGGKLFISIYNDQGFRSKMWLATKKLYNISPNWAQKLLLILCMIPLWGPRFLVDLCASLNPLKTWNSYKKNRGMSPWYDVVDWVGGYPFEVAKPEEVFLYYKKRGFELEDMTTCAGGLGCNEFVFRKKYPSSEVSAEHRH